MRSFISYISFIFFSFSYTYAYNILVIIPHNVRSHFKAFEPLYVELIKLHNVTIVGHFPLTNPTNNYQFINLSVEKHAFSRTMPNFQWTYWEGLLACQQVIYQRYTKFLSKEEVKEFLKSDESYDLVMIESFISRIFNAFTEKFKAPFIYLSSSVLFPHVASNIAEYHNPAYILSVESGYSVKMNFFERVLHTLDIMVRIFWFNVVVENTSQSLAKKYFESVPRSLISAENNVSLVFVNNHFTFIQSKPLSPMVIDVGGIHIFPAQPLPKNIEKFINESTHGVVYFCMGSVLRGETLPEEKRNAFLYAFSKIPQRVLWKWEGDILPGKSDNIMISKWMPQRDILAHPNVKLFISHGGLLGTSEAVYEGVPVIGIPVFGDQETNVKTLETNGAGELLHYNEITGDVVLEKIQRLINDPKYEENAKQLSARYRDRPMSPLNTAVYWTEYVIRHKGAPHLKTAAVDMPWYKYLLLDVIAFILLVFISALVIIYYSVKISLRFFHNLICGKSSFSKPAKKIERN